MSTKINARSPFFISYTEPTKPVIALTEALINAQGFAVGVQGNITLPNIDYGFIMSITSSSSDYSGGKWAVVTSPTTRTMTLRVGVPTGFSNEGGFVDIQVSASQAVADCVNRISLSPIPDKTLDVFGDSVSVTLSDFFTISAGSLSYKLGQNSVIDLDISIQSGILTIASKNTAGVFGLILIGYDAADSTTCEKADVIQVTVQNAGAFDCTTANLIGGQIAANGTLTTPNSIGTITATKETSGGSSVTSVAANSGGASISKTLYYDITVPVGYSNASATIECSKAYTQASTVVTPTLACSNIDFDDQAILLSGQVVPGTLEDHYSQASKVDITDFNYTPKSFDLVGANTDRDITYTITVPSGYTNTGNTLSCVYTITQPAEPTLVDCFGKNNRFYAGIFTPFPTDWETNFSQPFDNVNLIEYYSDVNSVYNLQGKLMCFSTDGGVTKTRADAARGTYTVIGTVNHGRSGASTTSTPIAFYIEFGSGNLVQHMWRKDYSNKITTQIF